MIPDAATSTVLDLNHPSLNEIQTYIDGPVLQHGLVYDADGTIHVKPDTWSKMSSKEQARTDRLISDGRLSDANAIAGCRRMRRPTTQCPLGHEVEAGTVICDKPLLHEQCATAKRRVARFSYEHPELHSFLLNNPFEVVTLTMPGNAWSRAARRDLRARFLRFAKRMGKGHGWAPQESFDGLELRVIHWHEDGLPGWPTVNAQWQRVAPAGSTLRICTYDGLDGDTQDKGLLYAMGGLEHYWLQMQPGEELKHSAEFRDHDLSGLCGEFRGWTKRIAGEVATESAPKPEMPRCTQCGRDHVPAFHLPLMSFKELSERFDHIRPVTYGQSVRRVYRISPTEQPVAPSPPPW